nr:hypothetical protein [Novosphingobium sp. P6W]
MVPNPPQPRDDPGIASAEDGVVILDGPNGIAITMTAHAAAATGHSLIAAAELAERQSLSRERWGIGACLSVRFDFVRMNVKAH